MAPNDIPWWVSQGSTADAHAATQFPKLGSFHDPCHHSLSRSRVIVFAFLAFSRLLSSIQSLLCLVVPRNVFLSFYHTFLGQLFFPHKIAMAGQVRSIQIVGNCLCV